MKYIIIIILSFSVLLTGCKKEEPIVNENGANESITMVNNIVNATSTDDKYKNWKTYRNEEYGFELKLPNSWDAYSVDMVGAWKPEKNQVVNIVSGDNLENYAPIQVTVLKKDEIELRKLSLFSLWKKLKLMKKKICWFFIEQMVFCLQSIMYYQVIIYINLI